MLLWPSPSSMEPVGEDEGVSWGYKGRLKVKVSWCVCVCWWEAKSDGVEKWDGEVGHDVMI